jgi:hypothetical protein
MRLRTNAAADIAITPAQSTSLPALAMDLHNDQGLASGRPEDEPVDPSLPPRDNPARRPTHPVKRRAWRRESPGEEIRAVPRARVIEAEVQAVAERLLNLAT